MLLERCGSNRSELDVLLVNDSAISSGGDRSRFVVKVRRNVKISRREAPPMVLVDVDEAVCILVLEREGFPNSGAKGELFPGLGHVIWIVHLGRRQWAEGVEAEGTDDTENSAQVGLGGLRENERKVCLGCRRWEADLGQYGAARAQIWGVSGTHFSLIKVPSHVLIS